MTLIVGTNSYITIAEADAYWSDRNNSVWSAGTTASKEKALIEATQYIDNTYDFIGYHGTLNLDTQPLAWPRDAVIIQSGPFKGVDVLNDVVPQAIKDAQAELALEALSARLDPVLDRGGDIKSVKVDVIEVEYMDWAVSSKTFNFVRKLLRPFTRGSKHNIRLERS